MVKQVDTRSIFRRNALSICSDWRGHTHRRGGGQTPGAKLDWRTHITDVRAMLTAGRDFHLLLSLGSYVS
jgi:hypothetical protein